jgi:divalent metal cation (Fe/Co/Zn/Cd) transporter
VVALLIAVVIAWTAWRIIASASATLSDSARMDPAVVAECVLGVDGVLGCHHIRTRGSEAEVHIDLHVQVDENKTVGEGHRIAEEVERALLESFPQVVDAIVHLEPYDEYQLAKTAEELDARA